MAKIKLGAIVSDIRGKLGGHVFSKNRSGAYMRTKVTPSNPQTSYQARVRAMFASISSAWSTLTNNQRRSFRDKVAQYQGTDIFGDVRVPSGKVLHHKLNQNLALSGQNPITECPNSAEVPSTGINGVSGSVASASLTMNLHGNTSGNKVLVFGTPPLSQGTKFVKNKLRLLGVVNGVEDDTVEIQNIYHAKFGLLSVGDNVVIGVKTVNTNGQASPMETMKAVIGS